MACYRDNITFVLYYNDGEFHGSDSEELCLA
jgi:hypothetical protein